jgi:hypothetical protein
MLRYMNRWYTGCVVWSYLIAPLLDIVVLGIHVFIANILGVFVLGTCI